MKTILLFLLPILFISCSALENENNELTYRWDQNSLVLENGTQNTLYYAVFEQESLAIIDWMPISTSENQLLPNSFIRINGDDIYDYEDGDKLVLYYWEGEREPFSFFKNVVIET